MRSKGLAAGNVPDNPQYPGVSAARVAYAVAQVQGFDQLSVFGPTASAQTSLIITGSTDYGPVCTCSYGATDTQILQQYGALGISIH